MVGSETLGILLILFCSISLSIALSFNLASFESTKPSDLTLHGDAGISGAGLELNRDATRSAGRALYRKPMQLWVINDGNTAVVADFSTHFTFDVASSSSSSSSHVGGGGLSFLMVPDQDSSWSPSSYGGLLGLFDSNASALDSGAGQHHQVVAVEFDEGLDPAWDFSSDHLGIDVNSLKSKRYVNLTAAGFTNKGTANVWVDYNSTTKNLSVSLTFAGSFGSLGVFHIVDLRDVLPERVRVGFTASTGSASVVIYRITSWSFTSHDLTIPSRNGKKWLYIGLPVFLSVATLVGIGIWWFILRAKDRGSLLGDRCRSDQFDEDLDDCGVEEVPYKSIRKGTKNFKPKLMIGKGASGAVYQCELRNPKRDVAAKIIKSGSSRRGVKEFISELSIVSKASHPNVVNLICWSRSNVELCLCFELMPNKSLNSHLHGKGITPLNWENRYKVMLGVASGVSYLHEGLKPSIVIHRDIKSDNVLLDAEYNAKVADFGVARFVELNQSMKTTDQYGTRGYIAPEVADLSKKATLESDVYSFGILLLEIVTGIDPRSQDLRSFVRGKDALAVVDERLNGDFDQIQARLLLDVGLWCCKRAPTSRPQMKDVIGVLDGCVPLPDVPPDLPLIPHLQDIFSLAVHSSTAEYHLPPAPAPASTPAPAPAGPRYQRSTTV